MKSFLTFISFLITPCLLFAQSKDLLSKFDKIPLGQKKYEITGYMAGIDSFGASVPNKYDISGYAFDEFENDSINVKLNYYQGVLFLKKLTYKYPMKQMAIAKASQSNLINYIKQHNVVISITKSVISNNAYGGDIGESNTFYLTKSDKNHKSKTADFEATLEFKYDDSTKKNSAAIIGYEVVYQCVDLSNTPLDAKTGYSSVQ